MRTVLPLSSFLSGHQYYRLHQSSLILLHPPPSSTLMLHPWPSLNRRYSPKPKIVVIMGPTGSGKSRLSIDLATRFFPTSEIINSDKIQCYSALHITTNKIPLHQQLRVTHHLLGNFHPSHSRPEFTPSDFRVAAASAISHISNRRNLPLVVGGSNSFIYALIVDHHDPNIDIFREEEEREEEEEESTRLISSSNDTAVGQRYDCCFIRIDVSFPVLNEYLVKRVDEMMGCGMLEELEEFFKSEGMLLRGGGGVVESVGLRKAIGVAELEEYFRESDEVVRRRAAVLEEAIENIKRNTCELARRQVDKMRRLMRAGWEMHKVEGTEALRAGIAAGEGRLSGEEAREIWERQVLEPSAKIVKQFLDE